MGEVYRAHDSRLKRDVALKILPVAFATDPDRLSRLRREAQVLASLNHPHIAHIYGLEESDGTPALVMELIEGQTLADFIRAGIPLAETISIARQIAEALESAHELGIIHRDLKPSNIKVREDGTVKVLDFGLAKATDAGASPNVAMTPAAATITSPAYTAAGVVLGTAAYMAPEQAKGKPADKRSDIWAFGCVLWEMLTGRALFARASMSETLAAVLTETPPLDQLPRATPAPVRGLVTRCLERDPGLRLRDIGEARIVLGRPLDATEGTGAVTRAGSWASIASVAAIAAIVGAALAWYFAPRTKIPVRQLDLPEPMVRANVWALSRDGTRIAYVRAGHLYVQRLDALEPQDLGVISADARSLAWSSDSTAIGFAADGFIETIPAAGGPFVQVARIPRTGAALGLCWKDRNTIAFAVWRDGVYSVPAVGGTPSVLVPIDPSTDVDFHTVLALPDGRLLLATHVKEPESYAFEIADGSRRTVVSKDLMPVGFTAPNSVMFLRGPDKQGVWGATFSGDKPDLSKATLIAPRARYAQVADDGTVVYTVPARTKYGFAWIDRSGAAAPVPGAPIEGLNAFDLSPDGTRAAYLFDVESVTNVAIRDLRTGADTRLTFNTSATPIDMLPADYFVRWFPMNDRLLYATGIIAKPWLLAQSADGGAPPKRLSDGFAGVVSHDGGTLVYTIDQRGRSPMRRAAIQHDGSLGAPVPVSPGGEDPNVNSVDLSPDDRLLAYTAVGDDRHPSVFITTFPEAQSRWLVLRDAVMARFSHDGHELFFKAIARDDKGRQFERMMSVTVTPGPPPRLSDPVQLFTDAEGAKPNLSHYSVGPDGRLLMSVPTPSAPGEGERGILLQNWPALLKH